MKLAYILNTYPQPSHSFIRREIQALERQGFEIERLAMRRASVELVDPQDRAEAEQTKYVLDAGGVKLLLALLGALFRRPANGMSALALVWRMGRASQTGVLRHLIYLAEAAWVLRYCNQGGVAHCHAHFGTNAATVVLLCRLLGGPSFSFTTHGPEEFDAPGALSLGVKLDHAGFAVGVSQFGRSQLSRWADFSTWPRLHVVHCGIEPEKFSVPAALPEGPLKLVSIGRFVEQKGQMVLVEAMSQLRDDHPDIHLTLVGDGEMRRDLEAAIEQYNLGDRITLTGWLSEAAVTAQLQAAHALVMPSFAEGLPMVVMEAMAAQRPVIATYIAGTPELVREGETGWLVPAGDAAALASAIIGASELGHDVLQAMGQAGGARVMQRHDVDVEARKLADLFRQFEM